MSAETIIIIIQKEIKDALRNRWFVVISVLFTLLSVSLSLLGLSGLGSFGIAGFGRTAASLLNLVLLIVPVMGLLLGAMSVVGEREQGTLVTLLAQPVSVNEVFLGKYLGITASVISTIFLGFGASALVIAKYAGFEQIGDYLILVLFTVFLGLAYLSIGFCISIFVKRHATAVGLALFTWFLFMFLSDLGLMGTAMVLKLSPGTLFWLVLINPAQAFKIAVIGHLQKSLEAFGTAGLYASEALGNWLVPVLFGAIAAWILLPLAAAFIFFRRRCVE
jgi:Cu-processing system permease protein